VKRETEGEPTKDVRKRKLQQNRGSEVLGQRGGGGILNVENYAKRISGLSWRKNVTKASADRFTIGIRDALGGKKKSKPRRSTGGFRSTQKKKEKNQHEHPQKGIKEVGPQQWNRVKYERRFDSVRRD